MNQPDTREDHRSANSGTRGRARAFMRRVLPWLVAAAILFLLFRRAGGAAVRDAVRDADMILLIEATVLCTLGMYAIDVWAFTRVISWFNCPVSLREIAPVKAASYLVNVLNYSAGTAGVAFWLKRRKGVPFLEAASALLFLNVVDALVLVAYMATSLPALEPPLSSAIAAIIGLAAVALTGNLLYWRKGYDFLILGRLRGWPIFKSFRQAEAAKYARLAAIRTPFVFFFILNFWFGLRAFGVQAPFLTVLACVPILTFIGTVPVTVAGLGTVQAATIFLFRAYAPEARLLAFSLTMAIALTVARALLGVPFFQRISDDLVEGS